MAVRAFNLFLDTNGDGSGSTEMAVDASVVPVLYSRLFARIGFVEKVTLMIETPGNARPAWNTFGDIAGLARGVVIAVWNTAGLATVQSLIVQAFIKTNSDFGRMGYSWKITDNGAGGVPDSLVFEFNLREMRPKRNPNPLYPLRLNQDWRNWGKEGIPINLEGPRFGVALLDDLSTVGSMKCMISGRYLNSGSGE